MMHADEIIKNRDMVLSKAALIEYPKRLPPFIQKRLLAGKIKILKLDSDIYFHINLPKYHYLVKGRDYPKIYHWILLSYLAVILILVLIYLALKRALKPIKKLESEIKKFGEGILDIDTKSDKKDEIAAVGNEFYNAVQKINALQNTRALFLRNMMHELKTPITKGKLSLSLMEENAETNMLDEVFHKLETLINEMADIEQVTTQDMKIEKKSYRLIDIVDYAKDLLYLNDNQLTHNITDQTIKCDFKLFGIAVKNLIDNAVKYSSDNRVEIKVHTGEIEFINKARPLEYEFRYYLEPFYKGELKSSNQKGFGLGLYIVNEILKTHDFLLEYEHKSGKNIFTIKLF